MDKDGCVWAWGYNYYGQLGNGKCYGTPPDYQNYESTPVKVKKDASNFLDNIVYIDAGFHHSMAIDKFGVFWVWGRNQKGQLGLGDEQLRYYATKIQ